MLSRIACLSATSFCKPSIRKTSTAVTTRKVVSYKKSLVFAGVFGSLAGYDFFCRDGESLEAVVRFLRSLKMGAQISLDYSVSLWNMEENSENYEKVRRT